MPFGEPHSYTPQLVVIPEIPDDLLPVDGENVVASGDFLSSLAVTMTPTVSFINGKFEVTLQPKVVAEVRGDTFGSDSLGVHNLSAQEEATFTFDSSLVEAGRTPLESLVSESSIVAPLYSTTLHPDINFGPGGVVVESTPPSPPIEISEEETLVSEGTVMPSILTSTTEKKPSVKPVLPIRSTDIPFDHNDTTKSSLSSSVHSTGSVTEDKVKDTSITTQVMGMTTQKDDSIKTTTHTVVSGLGPTSAHVDHLDTDESGLSVQTTKEFNLTLPTQLHSTTTTRKKDITFTFTPSSSETSEFMMPSTKNLEMTTAKNKLSPSNFSSVLPPSEASGDDILFRTTTVSSALYTISKSDQELSKTTKTISVSISTDAEITRDQTAERHSEEPVSTFDSTETSTEHTFISLSTGAPVLTESTEIISGSSSADVEATSEQTTKAHSREPVFSLDSTVTSIVNTFTSLSTWDSTGRTDTSQDLSHIATTTATPMEDKDLSAKPSDSTIINVTDTLLSSAHTGHLNEKVSENTATVTLEKTTVKDVLSPSSFSSSLPSTESEASGDDTSNMFSEEFTTTRSSLYTPDHELNKTSSDMTETISVSSSTDAEATRDQITQTHSRETISSLDSTVTSAVHPFSSLSTGDLIGETVTSKDVTSHSATTTATMMEDKDLSPKPSESTIIHVSETLFSSAHTRHLDETLSESTVTVIAEKTTAKDVPSSSFSISLPSTDYEASGDDNSDMFSKEFTTTSSSLYSSTKSDQEYTKTSSDMTETISVSSSTDAEGTRDQKTEAHTREPVSSLNSIVTSAVHIFSSLNTGDSIGETVTSKGVTSHAPITTATLMAEKDLSAISSQSTIINVSETLLSSAQTGHLDDKLSESAVTLIPEKTTAKDMLSPSSLSSGLPSAESEASGDDTLNIFSKEFTTTSSSLYTSEHVLTKTPSDMTETISVSSSTDAEATRDQTTETHSRETISSLDSTVTSAVHTFSSLSTGDLIGETVTSKDVTSHLATTTATMMEDKDLSPKPSESTIINVSETRFASAHTRYLDEKLSESTVTMILEKTTLKDVLSPSYFTVKDELSLSSFSSVMPSTESEASGDETSDMFSKEFTTRSSSLYSTSKSDKELSKTTETISGSSSTDADITRDQTTEGHSREPISSIGSTSSSIVHTFESLNTGDSTARTVTSQDVTSYTATITETVMEDKDLSAKPSESTIINVSETLLSSAHTGHLDEKVSENTATVTLEKTTFKDVLSPSSFSSSLPSTESEASGDDTSNMFSEEFTTTSSSLYTPDHELIKTSSDMTETISVSSSTDAEATRDQITQTHSRETISSLDSTVTSAVHPFSSLSTGDLIGETVTSKDVTSHLATTTATMMEDKDLSPKPSESTIINVSETLFSSAHTRHLDETLSESTVTVIAEKTTAKDVLSPSSFSSILPSTDSEASGDDTSDMFSKEFTTTSSSLYTSTKSDHELTKTSSDMTETISVSSSTDAGATRGQSPDVLSREPVSTTYSIVTNTVHAFPPSSTGESTGQTVRIKDVTSPIAKTTASRMEDKDLSAKPSEYTIINISETLLSSAQTGPLHEKLSESTVTVISEKTTAKYVLSPSIFSSSLPSTESEASGDDTSNMFSEEFTTTSSSLYTPDHELNKTLSDMTETISVSSSTDAEATRDQITQTHSRETISSLDSTVTSAVHPFSSLSTGDSIGETVTSKDVTSHSATTTATMMEDKDLSPKPSESTIINISETQFSSAHTRHLDETLSESTVKMIPEKTTAKDVLSPSSFSSSLPSTESEASGDETSNMFSKEFTTTSSLHYTLNHELTKTLYDMTETISLSSSTNAEASSDQTIQTHSRETISSLDSTVTSAVHPFSSLSTGHSIGETVTSKDVTSHSATTTTTLIEEKDLSAKPTESTIIDVSETLFSSAHTRHLDETLSESTVKMIPEKTTAKDVPSSSFSISLPSTDYDASGDDNSDMFSKEFTTTSSSLYSSTKSDQEYTKTSSDTTETISVSSLTDAEGTRDQTTEAHTREPVSSLNSIVTSAVHIFSSLNTGDSIGETVTSKGVTSHAPITTATLMAEKDLSAISSQSTIINVSETLLSSAQTGHLDDKLSESAVTLIPEKTTAKDMLSPSSLSSGLPSAESEASGDDTLNIFSKEFTTTSSSLYTSEHVLTKTPSDMTETISVSSSTDAEATRDQTTETHSRGTASSLDSTVTSAVHTFSSLSTGDSTGETVTSKDVTSHSATTTATMMEDKGLSPKPSESTIINVQDNLFSTDANIPIIKPTEIHYTESVSTFVSNISEEKVQQEVSIDEDRMTLTTKAYDNYSVATDEAEMYETDHTLEPALPGSSSLSTSSKNELFSSTVQTVVTDSSSEHGSGDITENEVAEDDGSFEISSAVVESIPHIPTPSKDKTTTVGFESTPASGVQPSENTNATFNFTATVSGEPIPSSFFTLTEVEDSGQQTLERFTTAPSSMIRTVTSQEVMISQREFASSTSAFRGEPSTHRTTEIVRSSYTTTEPVSTRLTEISVSSRPSHTITDSQMNKHTRESIISHTAIGSGKPSLTLVATEDDHTTPSAIQTTTVPFKHIQTSSVTASYEASSALLRTKTMFTSSSKSHSIHTTISSDTEDDTTDDEGSGVSPVTHVPSAAIKTKNGYTTVHITSTGFTEFDKDISITENSSPITSAFVDRKGFGIVEDDQETTQLEGSGEKDIVSPTEEIV